MTPNPFSLLFHSRKFWLLILDTLISLVLYFVGKYATPTVLDDIKTLVVILQPVFIVVIAAIAYEDAATAPFVRESLKPYQLKDFAEAIDHNINPEGTDIDSPF